MTITGYDGFGAPVWDHAGYQCAGCSTIYRSESAADACELEHVDDQRTMRGTRR